MVVGICWRVGFAVHTWFSPGSLFAIFPLRPARNTTGWNLGCRGSHLVPGKHIMYSSKICREKIDSRLFFGGLQLYKLLITGILEGKNWILNTEKRNFVAHID